MKWKEMTKLSIKRIIFVFSIIFIASILRIWPLGSLENKVAWLTFYPAIMAIALYSGFFGGILATILGDIVVIYGWEFLTPIPFIQTGADWLGMVVFSITCIFITVIAERMRQSEKRALVLREKAQSANESKTLFLANMSHELRTPLNAILGYSQILINDDSINRSNLDYIKIIHDSGDHLLTLINNILDVVKIESNKSTLKMDVFNFHEMISNIDNLFRLQVNSKNLIFSINGKNEIPKWVFGDELKIKVVLINLISNAIKFTNIGSVALSFSADGSDSEESFKLSVEIEDTGVGISKNEQEKLFKFFSQTTSGEYSKSGTGLGLAISQEYVKLMGGEIKVVSEVNKGSKFSFTINLKESFSHESGLRKTDNKVIGIIEVDHVPLLLIADDSSENRDLLKKVLEDIGVKIITASNGVEAVEQFKQYNPEMIFMDIRMPIMDGMEATKKILSLENPKLTKIIAVSAHVYKDEVDNILQAGFDDFVEKPYHLKDIYNVLKKHLDLQFIYSEIDEVKETNTAEVETNNLDITQEIKERLLEAVIKLNIEDISRIINEISISNPQAGVVLSKLYSELNFQEIWTLLKEE